MLCKSTDGGSVWEEIIIEELPDWFRGRSLAIDPVDPDIVYGGGYFHETPSLYATAVAKTTNAWSHSWTLTPLVSYYGYLYALAIDPGNSDILYAGGFCDRDGYWEVLVFKSTNSGTDWFDASSGIDSHYYPVRAIAVDPDSPNTVFAGTRGGIYKSTNGGLSWINTDCGFSQVHALSIDPTCTHTIYAGTSSGVYRSSDGGSAWSPMNQGLSVLEVTSFEVHPTQTNRIYAGTQGGGVFAQNTIGVEETECPIAIKNSPVLYQSSPNPFSTDCSIQYYLPSRSYISLAVYDLTGRLVRQLIHGLKEPGLHMLNWNGQDDSGKIVPSNVYFYQLQGKGFSVTRKLLFIR